MSHQLSSYDTLPVLPHRWYQQGVAQSFSLGCKRFCYTWPRRHGKDVVMLQTMIMEAMRRVGNYWYLFPTRAWAERAIWDNTQEILVEGQVRTGKLLDIVIPDCLPVVKSEKSLSITFPNGSIIRFGGTEKLEFVGQGGYGYGLSEYSLHRSDVTSYISPILEEANAFMILQGTLRGRNNHLYERFANTQRQLFDPVTNPRGWYSQWLTPELTKAYCWVGGGLNVNPELYGRLNIETGREYLNIQDLIDSGEVSYGLAYREYLNRATNAVEGGYYTKEHDAAKDTGRLTSGRYDPELPVFTFWDLGKGTAEKCTDAMSIWFVQFPDGDFHDPKKAVMIDYDETTGGTWSDHFIQLHKKGYWYGNHYSPWDIAKGIAGMEGNNLIWARDAGIHFIPVPRRGYSIMSAIEICRRRWATLSFSPVVADAVDQLASYHEKKNRAGVGMGIPDHDAYSSNCSDAFRTMCEALDRKMVDCRDARGRRPQRHSDGVKMHRPSFDSVGGYGNRETRPMLGGKGLDSRDRMTLKRRKTEKRKGLR